MMRSSYMAPKRRARASVRMKLTNSLTNHGKFKATLRHAIAGILLGALTALGLGAADSGAARAAEPENTLLMDLKDGPVVIELRPDLAPRHVARIKELVRQGFYDGLTFHRVIGGFMAQTGDPDGDGTGGSGVNLDAEFSSEPYIRGTLSMARGGRPDSADSQFFMAQFVNGMRHLVMAAARQARSLAPGARPTRWNQLR